VGEEHQEQNEVVEELSVSRKQIEDSYVRLKKLNDDGFEMVTNIRVAGDAREVQRRLEEEEAARHRWTLTLFSFKLTFVYRFVCFFGFLFFRAIYKNYSLHIIICIVCVFIVVSLTEVCVIPK